jgi:endonuclease V-like protein UPF0215 family
MGDLVTFRTIKKEIRIIGIIDCSSIPIGLKQVDLFGIIFRGGSWFDGIIRGKVDLDGIDATVKISEMIRTSPYYQQLRVIMLKGITFAGYNIVNIKKLFECIGLPVISVTKKAPDILNLKQALRKLPQWEKRWKDVEDAGKIIRLEKANSTIYLQIAGLLRENAEKIISISSTRSIIPESLRVAHIVASGLSRPLIA